MVAAVKFLGEEDVLQLGVTVGLLRSVAAFCIQVVDVDVAEEFVAEAGGVQHAGLGFDEPIQKQCRQQKRG